MHVVLDACTIINLLNGEVIQSISNLHGYKLIVTDHLFEHEILDQSQQIFIKVLIENSHLTLIESTVTITEFINLTNKYGLGAGETECIALCKKMHLYFASDDRKARNCGSNELGLSRVVGSIYFLKQLVSQGSLSSEEAYARFTKMKLKGAFLPALSPDYFFD